jgi:hypothetical protein
MESSGRRRGWNQPSSVGAQDRPHTLVPKVLPPSRRICSRRGEGAVVKGQRVCGTHLSAHEAVVLPGRTPRGKEHGVATLPLRSYSLFRSRDS